MTNLAPLWCVIDSLLVLAALGVVYVGWRLLQAVRVLANEVRALAELLRRTRR